MSGEWLLNRINLYIAAVVERENLKECPPVQFGLRAHGQEGAQQRARAKSTVEPRNVLYIETRERARVSTSHTCA